MTDITLVDNYDSFTWNLYHDLGKLGARAVSCATTRSRRTTLIARRPDAIVLSPGPCTPTEAGICLDVIAKAAATSRLFGVCLGLQAMGQAFGGEVVRAPVPMHGKVSTIHHRGLGVFRGINGTFRATRYHSLIVRRDTFPDDLAVTAESEDGLVMGLSHKHPAAARRPVPPGKHPFRARHDHLQEFPRPRLRME